MIRSCQFRGAADVGHAVPHRAGQCRPERHRRHAAERRSAGRPMSRRRASSVEGFEVEITGRPLPGWNVNFGYQPVQGRGPQRRARQHRSAARRLLKLFTTYTRWTASPSAAASTIAARPIRPSTNPVTAAPFRLPAGRLCAGQSDGALRGHGAARSFRPMSRTCSTRPITARSVSSASIATARRAISP